MVILDIQDKYPNCKDSFVVVYTYEESSSINFQAIFYSLSDFERWLKHNLNRTSIFS